MQKTTEQIYILRNLYDGWFLRKEMLWKVASPESPSDEKASVPWCEV